MANARGDGQKPPRRLSPWASRPRMTKPTGTRDRVNAALVRGKFMAVFGEIYLPGRRSERAKGAGLRANSKGLEDPPDPTVRPGQRDPEPSGP